MTPPLTRREFAEYDRMMRENLTPGSTREDVQPEEHDTRAAH